MVDPHHFCRRFLTCCLIEQDHIFYCFRPWFQYPVVQWCCEVTLLQETLGSNPSKLFFSLMVSFLGGPKSYSHQYQGLYLNPEPSRNSISKLYLNSQKTHKCHTTQGDIRPLCYLSAPWKHTSASKCFPMLCSLLHMQPTTSGTFLHYNNAPIPYHTTTHQPNPLPIPPNTGKTTYT